MKWRVLYVDGNYYLESMKHRGMFLKSNNNPKHVLLVEEATIPAPNDKFKWQFSGTFDNFLLVNVDA